MKGRYIFPVISDTFRIMRGLRDSGKPGVKDIEGDHFGIDIASKKGTQIIATADGLVVKMDSLCKGFGNVVIVRQDDGFYSLYAHLDSFFPGLSVGQKVEAGHFLGSMGNTGVVKPESGGDGTHLHFQIFSPREDAIFNGCSFLVHGKGMNFSFFSIPPTFDFHSDGQGIYTSSVNLFERIGDAIRNVLSLPSVDRSETIEIPQTMVSAFTHEPSLVPEVLKIDFLLHHANNSDANLLNHADPSALQLGIAESLKAPDMLQLQNTVSEIVKQMMASPSSPIDSATTHGGAAVDPMDPHTATASTDHQIDHNHHHHHHGHHDGGHE